MSTYDPALYADQLSELPAEVEVAQAAIALLRELRPILASLGTLQTTWRTNDIPALIEAAISSWLAGLRRRGPGFHSIVHSALVRAAMVHAATIVASCTGAAQQAVYLSTYH